MSWIETGTGDFLNLDKVEYISMTDYGEGKWGVIATTSHYTYTIFSGDKQDAKNVMKFIEDTFKKTN